MLYFSCSVLIDRWTGSLVGLLYVFLGCFIVIQYGPKSLLCVEVDLDGDVSSLALL